MAKMTTDKFTVKILHATEHGQLNGFRGHARDTRGSMTDTHEYHILKGDP